MNTRVDNGAVVDEILSAELRSLDATPSNTTQRQWVRHQDIVDEDNDGHLALRIEADGQATGAREVIISHTFAMFPSVCSSHDRSVTVHEGKTPNR